MKRATGLVTRPVAPILIREAPLGGPDYGHREKRYDDPGKVHITKRTTSTTR